MKRATTRKPVTKRATATAPVTSKDEGSAVVKRVPGGGKGKRPMVELLAIRERIESLMLQGNKAYFIHRALTSEDSPDRIDISLDAVYDHMKAVETQWRERTTDVELQRQRLIAIAEEDLRVVGGRATTNSKNNLGVGYMAQRVKLQERLAKLYGVDAPARTELTGRDGAPLQLQPVAMTDHPAEHLAPKELAAGYRRLAEIAERQAEDEPEPDGA